LIVESDETDNEFIAQFEWIAGTTVAPELKPAASPIPAPPFEELTRPNLKPHVRSGWDGVIVAKPVSFATADNLGLDLPVSSNSDVQINYVVRNSSAVDGASSFDISLLVDDQVVDVTRFPALPSGLIVTGTHVISAFSIASGIHTLGLVNDSSFELDESDENDNEFKRVLTFASGGPSEPASPTLYSISSLRDRLAALPELLLETLDVSGPGQTSRVWLPDILRVADAGYFLATGTAIRDERLSIEFYSRPEYELQLVETCLGDTGPMTASEHALELAECRDLADSSIGVQTHRYGQIVILIDTSHTPASVLKTLFHELGHARQELIAPTDGTVKNNSLSAIKEAQAQVFEAVGMRYIEEFLGVSVTSYPDLSVLRAKVQRLIDIKLEGANEEDKHDLGYVLMWLTALQDPGGLGLAGELRDLGKLTPASTLAFYNYLLTIEPGEAQSWVASRTANSASLLAEFEAIALGRLVIGLPPDSEGHPDLLDLAFLAP
jgi:hypothetical protein